MLNPSIGGWLLHNPSSRVSPFGVSSLSGVSLLSRCISPQSPGAIHRVAAVLLAVLFLTTTAVAQADVHTNALNREPLVREAFNHFYELDYAGTVERLERVHAAHPGDPQATALLLDAVLFEELYRLDLLDTTFYANDGFLTGRHPTPEDPKVRDRIFSLADEAVHEADERLKQSPNNVDALFARGWTRSLKAVYLAMVERAFSSGFHTAIQAKNDNQRVLQLDPEYADAKLVCGVYEYVVGALPWHFKLLVGFAGITGSKSKGLALLYDDGARGVITSVEARTAISLFLRREARYAEAIRIVDALRKQYPRDFLFCLEDANLRKDAGEGMVAVSAYRALLEQAAKPGYFYSAHTELAYFGLGESLRGQRHFSEAAEAYERAATGATVGAELKRRSLVWGGKSRDLNGERALALRDYQAAIDAGSNTTQADIARQFMRKPYKGK